MAIKFTVFEETLEEYQGESLSKSLTRQSGSAWGTDDVLVYSMVDADGAEKSNGTLTRSADDLSMSFTIGKTVTAPLLGKYLVLVSLENGVDDTISDVIAEYTVYYNVRKSR